MSYSSPSILPTLIAAALLGLIPAFIAKNKGHSFGLWWFYGFAIFIVAIFHAIVLKPVNQTPDVQVQVTPAPTDVSAPTPVSALSVADQLKQFKELLDSGAITEEEYQKEKERLLN